MHSLEAINARRDELTRRLDALRQEQSEIVQRLSELNSQAATLHRESVGDTRQLLVENN